MNEKKQPVKAKKRIKPGMVASQTVIYIVMLFVVLMVLMPLLITLLSSFKSNFEVMTGVWTIPEKLRFENWGIGFAGILPNMVNSIIVSLVSTFMVVFLGSMAAYVFVRHKFFGKKFLFNMVLALLMVPSVITLTPLYVQMLGLGLKDSWMAIWLPSIAGGQVGAIFLFTSFFSQQPASLYEAARIDGASEFAMYVRLCLPMAVPVLSIQAVNSFSAAYNDFLWPSLIIDRESNQLLMPILKSLSEGIKVLHNSQGAVYAIYLLSGIPLVVVTLLGLKYFVSGEFASGLKL